MTIAAGVASLTLKDATIASYAEFSASYPGDAYFTAASSNAVLATASYVESLYDVLLYDPSPTTSQLTYFENELETGSPYAAVATQFVTSDQYYTLVLGGWFERFLGRPTDPASQTYWVNAMSEGATDEQVIDSLVGTNEFFEDSGGSSSIR